MREVLFRGEYYNNFWKEGGLYCDQNKIYILAGETKQYRAGFYEINPETLGQYTGIIDRTGERIFERDVLIFRACRKCRKCTNLDNKECEYIIKWNKEEARFIAIGDNEEELPVEKWNKSKIKENN